MLTKNLREEIWQWVAAVPYGKVATYGQIARLAGQPRHARFVGSVLKDLPAGSSLPWHRVLRSSGELAFPPGSSAWRRQRDLLQDEGVLLQERRVSLPNYRWQV
jgi:methylated-DNA-protein-cysteine methyltransferase related protein